MNVTQEEFVEIIRNTNADKIRVCYESEVKMNKKQNPFYHQEGRSWVPDHKVTKTTVSSYLFGKNYTETVNEAAKSANPDKDVDFKAKDSYLESVIPDKLYKAKAGDQLYLRVMPDKDGGEPIYSYFVDGERATDEQMKIINEWETKREHVVHTQEDVGIEDFVRVFNYKLDQIIAVRIGDEIYRLRW